VDDLAMYLSQPTVEANLIEDPEHQAFAVQLHDRSAGYDRRHRIDLDFVTAGEFRTLASAYEDARDFLMGPVTIRTKPSTRSETDEEADEAEDVAVQEQGQVGEAPGTGDTAPAVPPSRAVNKDDSDKRVDSFDEL